ncbi:oligosaccharide repeat unit polymerase [Mariprofundus ferrooxydans]|nr:oligosaccharide repeat unit polymerase [Mariprofundus ferrooxydans]
MSEMFIIGHWPFLFLNGVVLWITGGKDWTNLALYQTWHLLVAIALIAIGLAFFLLGGKLAVRSQNPAPKIKQVIESNGWALLLTGLILACISVYAAWVNLAVLQSPNGGRENRSMAMLALIWWMVPAVLCLYFSALDKSLPRFIRTFAMLAALFTLYSMSWNWSRTPIIVTVSALFFSHFVINHGYINRRHFYGLIPLLIVLAVALLTYRVTVMYSFKLDEVASSGIFMHYLDKIWLDSSAFSALMGLIKVAGLFNFEGGSSLVFPFFSWLPRSLFPWKPEAFHAEDILNLHYTMGPSVYGEIMVNLTVLGVPLIMLLLGYLFKRIDLSFHQTNQAPIFIIFYLILVMQTLFLARGSFSSMMSPMVVQTLFPFLLYFLIRVLMALCNTRLGRGIHG